MYYNKSLQRYLDDLAAKQATPGGGSAAALVAAMGSALISMVVHFTLGKPRYIGYNKELKAILAQSQKLRKEFLRLVDADITAYLSNDFRKALRVPLEVCGLCEKAIALCPALLTKGNRALISDVAVAAILLESAFTSSYFNVEINLAQGHDRSLARRLKRSLSAKEKKIKRIRATTEAAVGASLRR